MPGFMIPILEQPTTSVPSRFHQTDTPRQSVIDYISNTGFAIGTYIKYSGSTTVGTFPFIWSPYTDTATDLNSLVTNESGWSGTVPLSITNVGGSDWIGSNGSILVFGVDSPYTSGKQYAVVSVPEPTGLAAAGIMALGTLRRRRRQH